MPSQLEHYHTVRIARQIQQKSTTSSNYEAPSHALLQLFSFHPHRSDSLSQRHSQPFSLADYLFYLCHRFYSDLKTED
jgi:hypothetical protein